MAFSYDVNELSTTPLYQVRFQIGDTSEDTHEFEDEELEFLLQNNSDDVIRTSIACCDNMLAKLANAIDYKLGPYSENGSDARYNRWSSLKKTLEDSLSSYCAPMANAPTTESIFSYDMMSISCCKAGDWDE